MAAACSPQLRISGLSDRGRRQTDHPNHQPSPWLADVLNFPPVYGGISTLRAQWRCCTITVQCVPPEGFQPGAWMVYALRGAVGDELFERELPLLDRASAWQALYSTRHLHLAKRQVPSPLLLDVKAGREEIVVTARLFGLAGFWRDSFIAALITALNTGVSISENSRERRPWRVRDFHYVNEHGLAPPPNDTYLRILPRSALCYGAERHYRDEPERFLLSALSRVALIARWHQVLLDFDIPDLAMIRAASTAHKGIQGPMATVRKHSRGHAGKEKLLTGEETEILMQTDNLDWCELLHIASACAAGGHAVYGFGRFDLVAA